MSQNFEYTQIQELKWFWQKKFIKLEDLKSKMLYSILLHTTTARNNILQYWGKTLKIENLDLKKKGIYIS